MASNILKAHLVESKSVVQQGDIFKNVTFVYDVKKEKEELRIVELTFPYVLVITQSCDMLHASELIKNNIQSEAKMMFSVIVVPIFEKETITKGEHYKELKEKKIVNFNINPTFIDKNDHKVIEKGMHYRFHSLNIDQKFEIPESIIDFKSFFTINVSAINQMTNKRVCRIDSFGCQQIVNKFAAFLSRVGLSDESYCKIE